MNAKLLVFGAAAALITAGAAQAATSRYAEPAQPIAYDKLNAYLKATPHQRAARDWSNPAVASAAGMSATNASTTQMAPTAAPMAPPDQTALAPTAPAAPSDQTAPAAPADQMQAPADQTTASPAPAANPTTAPDAAAAPPSSAPPQ